MLSPTLDRRVLCHIMGSRAHRWYRITKHQVYIIFHTVDHSFAFHISASAQGRDTCLRYGIRVTQLIGAHNKGDEDVGVQRGKCDGAVGDK